MPQDSSDSSTTTTTSPPITVPPTPPAPGGVVTLPSLETQPSYAGGITPGYKGLAEGGTLTAPNGFLNNKNNPYYYYSYDWQILLKIPKDRIVGLQTQLMQAFPGWKPDLMGRANDEKTKLKFRDLLAYINTDEMLRGSDYQTALDYYAKNPLEVAVAKQKPAIRLTNPIDLRKPFERGAQATIGEILTPGQTKKMEAEFAQMETQYQRGAATGTGGTVIQPPDPTAFAEEKARKLRPTAAKATEYSDYIGILSELLQG